MILAHLNYLAIAVSAVVYFALGAIYFNPKVLGTVWMKEHKLSPPTEEDRKNMGKIMALTLVYCLINCIALGCIVKIIHPYTLLLAIKIGLLASVFTFTTLAISYMYVKKSFKLILIDSFYHVIGLVIAAVIQTLWK